GPVDRVAQTARAKGKGLGAPDGHRYQPVAFVILRLAVGLRKRRRSSVTRLARVFGSFISLRYFRRIACEPGLSGSPSPRKVCERSSSVSSISMPESCFIR